MASPRWDLPYPSYQYNINELKRIYKAAILEVIVILEQLATRGKRNTVSWEQMTAVLAQLTALLSQLDHDAVQWVEHRIKEAFRNGQAETIYAIGEARTLSQAISLVSTSELVRRTADTLAADTFEDLLYANDKMRRETIRMIRSIVSEQMKAQAAMNQGVFTTTRAIVNALTKKEIRTRFDEEGNIAIIDRAGRRWKLEVYAEMLARTKLLQAHVEGIRVEALERGIDLAIISSHNAVDCTCGMFEGQVISLNGLTEGFMTYDELRRSNLIFHPNCMHKVTPIRDINLLPEEVRRKFERGRARAEEALRVAKLKK